MKRLLKIIALLMVLVTIGFAIFLLTLDLNRYKVTTENRLSQAFHRPVTIENMEIELALMPTIKVTGVVMGNPKNYELKEPFALIDTLEISFDAFSLFDKTFRVDSVHVKKLTLNLQKDKNIGRNNWNLDFDENSELGILSRKVLLDVAVLQIDTVAANYMDEGSVESVLLKDFYIAQMKNFAASTVIYKKRTFEMRGMINDLMGVIYTKRNMMFNTVLSGYNGSVVIAGAIGDVTNMTDMALTVDVSTTNLRDSLYQMGFPWGLLAPQEALVGKMAIRGGVDTLKFDRFEYELGTSAGKLILNGSIDDIVGHTKYHIAGGINIASRKVAEQYGLMPFVLRAKFDADERNVSVEYSDLIFSKTDLKFKGNIDLTQEKPFADGTLSSQYFNMDDIFVEQELIPTTGLFPQLDNLKDKWGILNRFNASLKSDFAHLSMMQGRETYALKSDIKLENGVLDLKDINAQLLEGVVQGSLRLDITQEKPALTLDLKGQSLNTAKIKEISDNIKGTYAHFALDVSVNGNNFMEMLASLNGKGEMELTDGKITNTWFNTLPRAIGLLPKNRSFSYSKTDDESQLSCAALSFNVNNGVMALDKSLAAETTSLNMVLSGLVDLSKQTLDVTMTPSISPNAKNIDASKINFSQVIKFTGPFMNLSAKKAMTQSPDVLINDMTNNMQQNYHDGDLCQMALKHKLMRKVKKEVEPADDLQMPIIVMPSLEQRNSLRDQFAKSLSEAMQQ